MKSKSCPVYSEPQTKSRVVSKLPEGTRVHTVGEMRNGFWRIKTKSGKALWVEATHFAPLDASDADEDIITETREKEPAYPRFQIDFGAAIGSTQGESFYELTAGVKYNFNEWLGWRNAPFYRFSSSSQALYGVDSSLRAGYVIPAGSETRIDTMVGLGFRLANAGSSAPLIECGAGIAASGFRLHMGLKYLALELFDPSRKSELLYSFTLGGSSSF